MAEGDSHPTLRLDEAADTEKARETQATLTRGSRWQSRLTALAWYLAFVLIIAPLPFKTDYPTEPGATARAEVVTPLPLVVEDREATRQAIEALRKPQQQIWQRETHVVSRVHQKINNFFVTLDQNEPRNAEELRRLSRQLADQYDIALSPSTIARFLSGELRNLEPPITQTKIRDTLHLIVNELINEHNIVSNKVLYQSHAGSGILNLYVGEVREESPPFPGLGHQYPDQLRDRLQSELLPRYFPGAEREEFRQAVFDLLMYVLEPNIVYSSSRTEKWLLVRESQLQDNPITRNYQAGDVIVHRGESLTRLQADALQTLMDRRFRDLVFKTIGLFLMTAAFFAATAAYLKRFRRGVVLHPSVITLHVLPPLMGVAIGQLIAWSGADPTTTMLWYPAAMIGMLSSLLITPQVAFVLVLGTTCLFGVGRGLGLDFMLLALFGGFAAVFVSREIKGRVDILRMGIKIGLVNAIAAAILHLINRDWIPGPGIYPDPGAIATAFANGLACALGTLILLVVFEWVFDVVTDLRLLELTGLKHSLIRQMEIKAPGTYQHTLNVTKLAEAAADAIDANTLLVRAGATFHDVGKMVKPKYFSENQITLEDKKAHSRLSPYMSVLIIKNHVKEGIEIARAHKLPQKIIDFIPQHHGTTLIRFFYSEALRRYEETGAVDPVREEDFRYPGPKPQTIESAIVLLADSVEAIAASKFTGGQVSERELRRTVQMAISERFNDGQFDECNLTMAHLFKIREALVRALLARYHFRVSYPSLPRRDSPGREIREVGSTQGSIAVSASS